MIAQKFGHASDKQCRYDVVEIWFDDNRSINIDFR